MAVNKKKGARVSKDLASPKARKTKHPRPTGEEIGKWVKGQHALNDATKNPEAPNMGAAFHEHGLNRPGRKFRAAAQLPRINESAPVPYARTDQGTEQNTFERYKAVQKWRSERPGSGSPSGATHQQWVSWGSRNPNRGSNLSHALSGKQWTKNVDAGVYNRFKHGDNQRED